MARIVDIRKVTVGPRFLDALIEIPGTAPRMTSDDPEGTARRREKTVRTMAILVKREQADEEVAEGLHVTEGSDVYKLVRLRYVNDVPNVFMENYVPCSLFPLFLENTNFSETRLYERMRELGRPVKTVTRRLEVIKADASYRPLWMFRLAIRSSSSTPSAKMPRVT